MKRESVVFGGSNREQRQLAHQVKNRTKIATSSLKALYDVKYTIPPRPGDVWAIEDGNGHCVCEVRLTRVFVMQWRDATPQFAIDEGDGTLENWLCIHRAYYSSLLAAEGLSLLPDTQLYAIYFAVI